MTSVEPGGMRTDDPPLQLLLGSDAYAMAQASDAAKTDYDELRR